MTNKINDAIRHLEKDMSDILDIIKDNVTSEIILNPTKMINGEYQGYVLTDKKQSGLKNIFKYQEKYIENETLTMNDKVVYKILRSNENDILYWVKVKNEIDLQKLTLCIKSFIKDNVIYQTENIKLIELCEIINRWEKVNLNYTIEDILDSINNYLKVISNYSLKIITIFSQEQLNNFSFIPNKIIYSEPVKISANKAETIMSVLASITGKFIHPKSPYLECHIPKYGHRFTGVIPPVVPFPSFCIRKHVNKIFTLDDFVKQGILDNVFKDTIVNWIKRKFNILITGGTGSGKTTLANAILNEITTIFPETRMLIIEDVPELKYNTNYSVGFVTGEFFSMNEALRTTLRFKPDRIIMGEIRGGEAYTLLKAWNTGHPGGVATIHSNGVNEALYRFENCVNDHPDVKINKQEIGFTINGIISIQNITFRERLNGELVNSIKRKVTALRQVLNYDSQNDIYQDIVYEQNLYEE